MPNTFLIELIHDTIPGASPATISAGLKSATFPTPAAAITAPTGGATVDAEARAAINSIITAIRDAGITL